MIRGAIAGSLALIILYAVSQNAAADKAQEASNILVAGLKRLLDPGVAGIGNHATNVQPSTPSTPSKPGGTPVSTTPGPYFQNV